MAEKKPQVDWEAIEREYRTGQLSNVMLGKKHGVSEGAIRKRVKADGWQKDLAGVVRERVREKLVREEVREPNVKGAVIVETAASTGAEVVRTHRRDLKEATTMASILLSQLKMVADKRDEISQDIEEHTKEDKDNRRYNRMIEAISLPRHAAMLRDLSTCMKNFIPLERHAYNLDEQEHEEPYEARLKRLLGES